MKGVVSCIVLLMLLQLSAAKKQPTYEELLLKVKSLEEKVDARGAIMDSMKTGLNAKISSLDVKYKSMNTILTKSRQTAYFIVDRSSDMTVSKYGKVKFNSILHILPSSTNFDTYNGIYRCPYDGTYLFFVTLSTYRKNTPYQFAIKKDGSALVYTYTHLNTGTYANYYESVSAMAVTQCKKGQTVYVQETHGYAQYVYYQSHFTGCKIA